MRKNWTLLASALTAFLAFSTSPVRAKQLGDVSVSPTKEENAEERINFSGKLRMLSQRIPAAACHLSRGIDIEGSSKLLVAAPAEFEKILTALEFGGDAELNIKEPETRRKTLLRIHKLREEWEPMKAAAQAVSDGTGTEEDVRFILTQNMKVLQAAVDLVPELVKQYSNPNAVPYAELLLIDISGRQRMLTQKMSKESCIMGTPHRTEETPRHLEGTMRIFEASLDALRFGMPDLGVRPPPNDTISAGLEVVLADWTSVKPYLVEVLAEHDLEGDAQVEKFQGLNTTMANMNTVVGMYTAAAKPSS